MIIPEDLGLASLREGGGREGQVAKWRAMLLYGGEISRRLQQKVERLVGKTRKRDRED